MIKLKRCEKNPILKPNPKNKWESQAVFNPGALYKDGLVYLLYRAIGEYKHYISRLGLAISQDGINFERVSDKPVFEPGREYDRWACEDPRITQIGDKIYVTYVALARPCRGKPAPGASLYSQTALLSTEDFHHYKRHGIITSKNSDNRDVVLFPEKINGQYVMIHRPSNWSKDWFKKPESKKVKVQLPCPFENLPDEPSMWLSYSYDFRKWFGHKIMMESKYDDEGKKIGAGTPPIKTKDGWLIIYHKVLEGRTRPWQYNTKVALLDLKKPWQVISRLPYPILEPEKDYELKGDVDNVVFPEGIIIKDGLLYIYYGGADKVCGLATVSLSDLLKELKLWKL